MDDTDPGVLFPAAAQAAQWADVLAKHGADGQHIATSRPHTWPSVSGTPVATVLDVYAIPSRQVIEIVRSGRPNGQYHEYETKEFTSPAAAVAFFREPDEV